MRTRILLSLAIFTFFLIESSAINYYDIKLAANDYLLIFHTTTQYHSKDSIQYQCSAYGNKIFEIDFDLKPVYSVSIGREQTQSQLYFVLSGIINKSTFYMSKITVNCHNNTDEILLKETVFFEKYRMSHMITSVDPHGRFAVGLTNTSLLYYDLINLQNFSLDMTWPDSKIFLPLAVDISNQFIYIAGYSSSKILDEEEEKVEVIVDIKVYLLSIEDKYMIKFYDVWLADQRFINPMIKLSLRVNSNNEHVLVGIPSINTVHLFITNKTLNRLIHVSSVTKFKSFRLTGYGWGVEWLNDDEKAIILNIDYNENNRVTADSYFEYYDMNNNITNPFSIFPNNEQNCPRFSKAHFLFLTSTTFALYVLNVEENLLIIPSSQPGYYSVEYLSSENLGHEYNLFSFIPNIVQCRPGTYKNESGTWSCHQCKGTTMNNLSSNHSTSVTCPQCTDKLFCPLEFINTTEQLFDVAQYTGYPETSEIDVFEDILMRNMFRTVCLQTSPFLFTIIVLIIVLILSFIIHLMRVSKRLVSKQRILTKCLRHFDFIEDGQCWFSGLISIVLLILLGFAINYSYVFYYQYPIESKYLLNQNTCHSNDYLNAKFETNLQFLNSPPGQLEQIFHLLISQEFTLNIELINTTFHCGHLNFQYRRVHSSVPFTCYTNGLTLYIFVKLSTHSLQLLLQLIGSDTIEAIRIGLTGPDILQMNNYVQKLNFSKVFNYTNRVLARNNQLFIGLQLTKIINITEGLTYSEATKYSGLWLPTFNFDIDQLFIEIDPSSDLTGTVLSLEFSETPFFIQNKQKPIARSSEIIFNTILFICVCLDLLSMIFLLNRLWFKPVVKFVICKLFSSNCWINQLIGENKKSTLKDIDERMMKMNCLKNEIQQHLDILTEKMNVLLRE
ncbi:unnamed protein product [Adineta steineri]|uniref:Transmembrane protein n=1 Tax=Adineta steineri TaxID=433720 RepID=A0A814K9N0_9BILA|nr:unnamed protein product [Adineta steineri]CAF1081111.1 unnamed protein product [Adineta steineri]